MFSRYILAVSAMFILSRQEASAQAASAPMSEERFNAILDRFVDIYEPIATQHGARLEVHRRWEDNEVNANSLQWTRDVWELNVHGGLARDPRFSEDSFMLVVCHEMGHHFGGFPYLSEWGANEGQADYFATQSCAREIWRDETSANAAFRGKVDAHAKGLCDKIWTQTEDQDLCYRSMTASLEVAKFLGHGLNISFKTPSRDKAGNKTKKFYPTAQCRLDTMMAGALCTKSFNPMTIPTTEEEAADNSCLRAGDDEAGMRPACWFVPTI